MSDTMLQLEFIIEMQFIRCKEKKEYKPVYIIRHYTMCYKRHYQTCYRIYIELIHVSGLSSYFRYADKTGSELSCHKT